MALPALLIPTVVEAGIKVIERIFPDPTEAAKAKLTLFELQQKGELANLTAEVEIATAQAEINKVEAAGDFFRGGWRPAVGWICALGLSYQFIARPTMNFILALAGHGDISMGALELETLMTLLFGMLGLGWYRSQEKIKGVN